MMEHQIEQAVDNIAEYIAQYVVEYFKDHVESVTEKANSARPAEPKAYSVNDTADMLCVSPTTVRAEIRRGNLSPVKIGRAVRIPAEEIRRYMKENAE